MVSATLDWDMMLNDDLPDHSGGIEHMPIWAVGRPYP